MIDKKIKHCTFLTVLRLSTALLAVLALSNCMLFEDNTEPEKYSGAAGFQSAAPAPVSKAISDEKDREFIEIVWQVPSTPVDGYLIRYGSDREHLTGELTLKPSEIQKIHHERYGDVYRFLLANPPRDKVLYVSITATSNNGQSAPSKIFEVGPDTPLSTPTPAIPGPDLPPSEKSSEVKMHD